MSSTVYTLYNTNYDADFALNGKRAVMTTQLV